MANWTSLELAKPVWEEEQPNMETSNEEEGREKADFSHGDATPVDFNGKVSKKSIGSDFFLVFQNSKRTFFLDLTIYCNRSWLNYAFVIVF